MADGISAAWVPDSRRVAHANVTRLGRDMGLQSYPDVHRWSVEHRAQFWEEAVKRLGIVFDHPPTAIVDGDRWLPGATMNVVSSCFGGDPRSPAIITGTAGAITRIDLGELEARVGAAATGLRKRDLWGARIAIAMPMTVEAVVAYLAIIAGGGVVVSIADSFAPDEIATRLRITSADVVVTSDVVRRAGRTLPMFDKVVAAGAERCIVVGDEVALRPGDIAWGDLMADPGPLLPIPADPSDHINILFSSGTTGDPKAIPWTHLTPIKAAMDGHFHHDIHPGDVVAWPTNLGWMMGPWLIFSSLVNGAAMALYDDAPTTRGFAEFVSEAGVTMLGVVPSLVAAWRAAGTLEDVDWSAIETFSSTGEASRPDDMAWLMAQAGGRPMVEYCGGTEIGGGYITGTVVQPCVPGAFSTPALGLDITIRDEAGAPAEEGEVFLVPPSIGLSTELLNRDHDDVYFSNVPEPGLRRHGDHMQHLGEGYYRAMGRVDDTMNLGGIKVSSAEIERTISGIDGVSELAAVAVPPPGGGPDELVVFAVAPGSDPDTLRAAMAERIRSHLNPLFKLSRVELIDALPRTASNKVMRRTLRHRAGT